jgi:hypothetical protein
MFGDGSQLAGGWECNGHDDEFSLISMARGEKPTALAPDYERPARGAGNKGHADVMRVTRNGNIFFFKYYFEGPPCGHFGRGVRTA